MAREEEVVWQMLATRIPKELHRRLRLHCLAQEITMMAFVVKAIEERLARERKLGDRAGLGSGSH